MDEEGKLLQITPVKITEMVTNDNRCSNLVLSTLTLEKVDDATTLYQFQFLKSPMFSKQRRNIAFLLALCKIKTQIEILN